VNIYAAWLEAKEYEKAAAAHRRELEDLMTEHMQIPEDLEGITTKDDGEYKITVTGRIARKVDADAVQEIAAEIGVQELLSTLFRWKPEINTKAWKAADISITSKLAEAITAKPGRPSYKIERKGE
jgi:hypothetical protein